MQTTTTPSSCPNCGYSNGSDPYYNNFPNDVSSLQGAIHNLNHHIQQLNAHKASLLRQLNFIQSSTRNIPPENLSIIFQHLCTDVNLNSLDYYTRYMNTGSSTFDRNRSVIRLGAVSSLWRQVAWSTPELWTTLIMTVQSHTSESSAEISQLSLANAKTLPVTLDLHFVKPNLSSLTHLQNVLFSSENAAKIDTLTLHNPPIEWMSPLSEGLSQLSNLTLKGSMASSSSISFRPRREISLASVPNLHHLTLRGIRDSITIVPSAKSITTLDLFGTAIHICARLFTQCPNLIECHCRSPVTFPSVSENHFSSADAAKAAIFPSLKVLTWPLCEGRSNSTLLRHIRFPVLETLRLYGSSKDRPGQSKETIVDFFARLPSTLLSLELVNWSDWSRVDLVQLLCSMDNLRNLDLHYCYDEFPDEVVRALTPGEDGDPMKWLPSLTSLSIRSRSSRFVALLVDMVEKRGDVGLDSTGLETTFRLRVVTRQDDDEEDWLMSEVGRLEDAIHDAGRRVKFELEILDSS